MDDELIQGGFYRHFKSRNSSDKRYGVYKVLGTAEDSKTNEEIVLYKQFYESPKYPKGKRWTRTKKEFLENFVVDKMQVPRFEFIGMQMPGNDKKRKKKK